MLRVVTIFFRIQQILRKFSTAYAIVSFFSRPFNETFNFYYLDVRRFIDESGFRFVALVTVDHKTYWTVINQCAKVTSFESFGLIGSV